MRKAPCPQGDGGGHGASLERHSLLGVDRALLGEQVVQELVDVGGVGVVVGGVVADVERGRMGRGLRRASVVQVGVEVVGGSFSLAALVVGTESEQGSPS